MKNYANDRILSVSTASAHNKIFFREEKKLKNELLRNIERLLQRQDIDRYFKLVLTLQLITSARISEILSISQDNITESNLLIIRAKKRSEDRICSIYGINDILYLIPSKPYTLADYYSRYAYYRDCRKYGIFAHFGNNQNASVTHYIRHQNALSIKKAGFERDITKKHLGHKSSKSTEYYEQQQS